MTAVELRRITDDEQAMPCDALFREYVGWVDAQLRAVHGLTVDDAALQEVHAAFRREWPKMFGPGGRMYLAIVGGEPAGVAALKPLTETEAELKRMYVRPAWRGHNVARRLLGQVIDDARHLGYRGVRLESLDFMRAAHALYRSTGFVEIDPYDGLEGARNGVDRFELFMRLDLAAG